MLARKLPVLLLTSLWLAESYTPAAEKPQKWLEVKSPHFVVATNANEKPGRRVADQFERIRSVFLTAFPHMRVDPSGPIIVLATKDEASFKELEPADWRKKGQLQRAGMFLRGEEKNYVLFRMDVDPQERDHIIYHEYTHMLLDLNMQSVPLWLDEGLAEFYGNSEIRENEALLGKPDATYVQILRTTKLLPFETLFSVDHSSPYYNEQHRGTIFYAESWALTHYLMMKGYKQKKSALGEFTTMLTRGVDKDTAATGAFGSLNKLQDDLTAYLRQFSMNYLKAKVQTEKEEDSFGVRELTSAESAAARGDFLVHVQAYPEAKALLERSLKESPNLAIAHESMGFLELRQNHLTEAKKWFTQAVQLDSQSYLAHYYYAVMTLREPQEGGVPAEVASSLRAAIKINPSFAPAYAALASFYGSRGENLEEAHLLALHAVQLEPANVHNILTTGAILLRMNRVDDAVRVGERARTVAKSPEDAAAVQSFLQSARQFQEYRANMQMVEREQQAAERERQRELAQLPEVAHPAPAEAQQPPEPEVKPPSETRSPKVPPLPRREPQPPHGAQSATAAASGRIASVTCTSPTVMDLILDFGSRKLALHANNYFKVRFLSTDWKPPNPFNPCQHIQGMWARAVFRVVQGKPFAGEIISLQLEK